MTEPALVWPPTLTALTGEGWVGLTDDTDGAVRTAFDAALAFCERVTPEAERGAETALACYLLATRWYHRRNAPLGLAEYADIGAAAVRSSDPDAARLLRLDRPRVG